MPHSENFWMACDSTEHLRSEYGPFATRAEAEFEARKMGFGYLLRYEHVLGDDENIQEVRSVFIELGEEEKTACRFHTRCATCGEFAVHEENYLAEVWADIHEFEHLRHHVRFFRHTPATGLKEVKNWRECA